MQDYNMRDLIEAVKPRNFVPEEEESISKMVDHFMGMLKEPPIELPSGKLKTINFSELDGYRCVGWKVDSHYNMLKNLFAELANSVLFFRSEAAKYVGRKRVPGDTAMGSLRKLLFNIHYVAKFGDDPSIGYGEYAMGCADGADFKGRYDPTTWPTGPITELLPSKEIMELIKEFDETYNLKELGETEDDYWRLINNG